MPVPQALTLVTLIGTMSVMITSVAVIKPIFANVKLYVSGAFGRAMSGLTVLVIIRSGSSINEKS